MTLAGIIASLNDGESISIMRESANSRPFLRILVVQQESSGEIVSEQYIEFLRITRSDQFESVLTATIKRGLYEIRRLKSKSESNDTNTESSDNINTRT